MKAITRSFFIFLLALAVSPAFFASCNKHDDDHHDDNHNDPGDTSKPVITMTSPSDSSMYNDGDTIWMKGAVTDNDMHEINLVLTGNSATDTLYEEELHVHGQTNSTINKFWVADVSTHTNATLTI